MRIVPKLSFFVKAETSTPLAFAVADSATTANAAATAICFIPTPCSPLALIHDPRPHGKRQPPPGQLSLGPNARQTTLEIAFSPHFLLGKIGQMVGCGDPRPAASRDAGAQGRRQGASGSGAQYGRAGWNAPGGSRYHRPERAHC